MNKNAMIVLLFVLGIGLVLFADQVLAVFQGMTVLQAMETIWTFVLHVAVTTLLGYVVVGLPAIVKPWVQMLKRSGRARRRAMRRGEVPAKVSAPRAPRMNKDAVIAWLASRQLAGKPRQENKPQDESVRFEL